jgi:hypothetical protein
MRVHFQIRLRLSEHILGWPFAPNWQNLQYVYYCWLGKLISTLSRFKETTPYAIANMSVAVKDMQQYINNHVFQAMEYWLRGKDAWVQETFKFARQYMTYAVSRT